MSREEIEKEQMGELPGSIMNERGYPPGYLTPAGRSPRYSVPPDVGYQAGTVPPPQPNRAGMADKGDINDENNPELLKAIRRQAYFMTQPFEAITTPLEIRPLESRTYLLIQNIDTVGDIFIGFGNLPTPDNNLTLTPGSAYEPFEVPINDIYVRSSVGIVKGYCIYAREVDR